MANYEFLWKIMMLGDNDIGKTSLLNKYTTKCFIENQKPTTGVEFYTKDLSYNDRKIKLQFWDFGGESRFRFFLPQYVRGANGALFLYNVSKRLSLRSLPELTEITRENAGDIPILLVGTEAHLEEKRAVKSEEGYEIAREHNLSGFIEVSSKTGYNIEKLFETMTEILFDRYRSR